MSDTPSPYSDLPLGVPVPETAPTTTDGRARGERPSADTLSETSSSLARRLHAAISAEARRPRTSDVEVTVGGLYGYPPDDAGSGGTFLFSVSFALPRHGAGRIVQLVCIRDAAPRVRVLVSGERAGVRVDDVATLDAPLDPFVSGAGILHDIRDIATAACMVPTVIRRVAPHAGAWSWEDATRASRTEGA